MYLYNVKLTDPYDDITKVEYFESETKLNSEELTEILLSAQRQLIKLMGRWKEQEFYNILEKDFGLFYKSLDCESSGFIKTRGY
jgi:transposase